MNEKKSSLKWGRLLALAAVLSLGTWLATEGVMGFWVSGGGFDIKAGHRIFANRCETCHSPLAELLTHNAPNLADIGRTAASRRPDQTGSEYLLESILDPDAFLAPDYQPSMLKMPSGMVDDLAPDEIRNLIAYLASRGRFPKYREIASLEIPDLRGRQAEQLAVSRQQMELAEHVLREKASCFKCHAEHSSPEYKIFAPGLFGMGLTDTEQVKESILNPHKVVSPAYQPVSVVLTSGKVVTGRIISRTDDRLVLFTRDPQNQLVRKEIPLADVDQEDGQLLITESKTSLMPEGFAKSITGEEIEALITLIRQLN